MVFLKLEGNRKEAGAEVEGEVVSYPGIGDLESPAGATKEEGGTHLLIRHGSQVTHTPIELPARCVLGKDAVKVRVMSAGAWFEIRVGMSPKEPKGKEKASGDDEEEQERLLDADQLTRSNPTSFICGSCSLPVVAFSQAAPESPPLNGAHSSPAIKYQDLPSSHWEELLESWMCHSSQKLNEEIASKSRNGFIPGPQEVYVGKSFFLLDGRSMVSGNILKGDIKVSFVLDFPLHALLSIGRSKKSGVGSLTSESVFVLSI